MQKTLICAAALAVALGAAAVRGTFDLATFTGTDEISGSISSVGS
jgi:hypothetical protein